MVLNMPQDVDKTCHVLFFIYIYIYIYRPRTQMTPVLIGKWPCFGGQLGSSISIYIYIYI